MVCTNARARLCSFLCLAFVYMSAALLLSSCGGAGRGSGGVISSGIVPAVSSNLTVPPNFAASSAPLMSQPSATVESSPTNGPTTTPQAVPVQLNYVLPSQATASLAALHASTTASTARQLKYISPANTLISITVTPLGGTGTVFGTTPCSTVACAINFTATPGPNTIVFTLTDGATTLSTISTTTIIQPTTKNTLNFTANPVVNSVSLSLAAASVNGGTATDDLLTVSAKDTHNNTIVGNSNYVDANGNPLAFTLSVTNAQAGGKGSVAIKGPARIIAPSQAAIYAHYDGNWLASSTISVTTSGSIAGALTGVTLTTTPYATEYPVTGSPYNILPGPDGNMWFTEYSDNAVGKITPNGSVTMYGCGACVNPWTMSIGPDNNMWYVESGGSYLDKLTTSGTSTRIHTLPSAGNGLTNGPDGNLWYSDSTGDVGRINTTGASTQTYAAASDVYSLSFGPDENLWMLDINLNKVIRMTPSGVVLGSFTTPNLLQNSNGITAGPDGNMWFTCLGSNKIGRVTMTGTVSNYALQAGAKPWDVTVGPDGYLWFTENGKNTIGRISTSGALTEYTNVLNGIGGGSAPAGITVGPDGNIWFTEFGTNHITKFVY